MAAKLISLRDVPEDEAAEIRALLDRQRIDYYETPAGNWGISAAVIWLHEDDQLDEAKALLDEYQQARAQRTQSEYRELQQQGQQRRFIDEVFEHPVRVVALLALAGAIAYFSVVPFIEIGQSS